MRSRGYQGDVYVMQEFDMRARDWAVMAGLVSIAVIVLWVG